MGLETVAPTLALDEDEVFLQRRRAAEKAAVVGAEVRAEPGGAVSAEGIEVHDPGHDKETRRDQDVRPRDVLRVDGVGHDADAGVVRRGEVVDERAERGDAARPSDAVVDAQIGAGLDAVGSGRVEETDRAIIHLHDGSDRGDIEDAADSFAFAKSRDDADGRRARGNRRQVVVLQEVLARDAALTRGHGGRER